MVIVSQDLVYKHLKEFRLAKVFTFLESDIEVQSYLRMSNLMAVDRLGYNDHGPVHSRIISGSALEIFKILSQRFTPTTVKDGICDMEGSAIVVLCGVYLHDIGNAVHRTTHHIHGCTLASPILDRLLPQIYPNDRALALKLKTEILHCIFAHDENVQCLSIEAGIAKVADGTDMAEGRARIPYKAGKIDIHSLSAISIKSVEIQEGETVPVRILVNMDNPAGVFQIEEVLQKKIASSGIDKWTEVVALERGKEIKTIPAKS